ncbi:hypothetical protein A2U01_0007467, partial [Trifolium medium]|nr:hypothetical protein [Trifolium medium]
MNENNKDEKLQEIMRSVQQDPLSKPGYEYRKGVLLYEGRRMAANVYWVGMKSAIQEYVRSCDVCQRQKYLASSPGGLLQPLPIPEQIWEDISMDFITGLPKSKGYEAILVVVDRLSKYSHFIPLKHPYTARSIAEIFCKEVVRLHAKFCLSSRNGWSTEVVNRCLETYLRCFIADQPKTWVVWVCWVEYWFNTTFHSSTEKTPFEIVYGRAPPVLTRWLQGETKVEAVQRELIERDEALRQLRSQLSRAQEKMKGQADKKRVEKSYAVGEWVFVKLRAHRQNSVVTRINAKLAARYYGPYPILERIAVGNYQEDEDLPDMLEGEQVEKYEPETVLATRKIQQNGEEIKQYLIQWKGKTAEEATWEEAIMMKSQFPKFSLEDKALVEEESIDRAQNAESPSHEELIHHKAN